ncbi:hypothetical protein MMIC_P1697 [Mariprofundus micogutta]|uniref:Uncharacterized protein n=1 Tax=Mariprofundus micogutta TaxID=1921010 RepID=A0A1L8CPA8_9PROT|nr:hypothetical protein [Mariprofundus micogutta]GAV20724.1 hypothetical protein MMIC_P1697 [Mariprofundus micogutta]
MFKSKRKDRRQPLKRPTLGISWIQGEFHAVYFDNGICASRWQSEERVSTTQDFKAAALKATTQLKVAAGSDVAMVYESDNLAHPFIQVPPMSSKDLQSFLKRRAPQEKAFSEDAAWSWTHTFAAKEAQGILLHLLPESFRKEIVQTLEDLNLYPKSFMPLSEVMAQHTMRLSVEKTDVVAMLATFSGETDILITRGDGEILFIRDLGYNWQDNIEILVRDIDRSILYAKQQFGVAVNKLSTAGDGSGELHEQLESRINLPILAARKDDHHAFCWAMDICRLPARRTSNLVPSHIQRRRVEKHALRLSVMFASVLMICAAIVVIQVEILVSNSSVVHGAKEKLAELTAERNQWADKMRTLETSKNRLAQLNNPNEATYPVNFFAYLGDVIPAGLILTKATVTQKGDVREFSISGKSNSTADSSMIIRNMEKIEAQLSAPPLNALMDDSWKKSPDKVLGRGNSEVFKRLSFKLNGYMK